MENKTPSKRFSSIKKHLIYSVIGALILFFALSSRMPVPIPKHTNSFYVNDYSHVLSEAIERKVYSESKLLHSKTKAQVVLVTVPNTLSQSLEFYSINLANTWGIGDKELNNGILLLFTTDEPHVRLEVGKGLEADINDAKAGRILDDYAVEYKNKRLFDQASYRTFAAIMRVLYAKYQLDTPASLTIPGVDAFLATLPETLIPAPERAINNNNDQAISENSSSKDAVFADGEFPEIKGKEKVVAILGQLVGSFIAYWIFFIFIWPIILIIKFFQKKFKSVNKTSGPITFSEEGYKSGKYDPMYHYRRKSSSSSDSSSSRYDYDDDDDDDDYDYGGGGSFGGGGASR